MWMGSPYKIIAKPFVHSILVVVERTRLPLKVHTSQLIQTGGPHKMTDIIEFVGLEQVSIVPLYLQNLFLTEP